MNMNALARLLRRIPLNNFDRRQLYLRLIRLAALVREVGRRVGL
jgi:hypothetical protein